MGSGKIFGDESKIPDKFKDLYVGDYSTKDVYIQSGGTLVLWQNEKPSKTGYTLDDFNSYYGTNLVEGRDIISVPYTGIHNSSKRGFFFGTDEYSIVVNAWCNEDGDAIPKNNPDKLAFHYEYSGEGNACTLKEISAATPGAVDAAQIPPVKVNTNNKELSISVTETNVDAQGNFNIKAEIPFEGTKAAMFTTLFYRQKSQGLTPDYTCVQMVYGDDGKTFSFQIPANELYADEVEWYIKPATAHIMLRQNLRQQRYLLNCQEMKMQLRLYYGSVAANEKSDTDAGQYT